MSENLPPFPLDGDDRFREVEHVGRGGMGRVWRAHYRPLDVWAAVKVPHLGPDVERSIVLELFRNEVVAYAQLDHPNIVRALVAELNNATPWYAMRWVEGEPLSDWLLRHLPADQPGAGLPRAARRRLVGWVLDAADAMAYAHVSGVIHRDLTPRNLLLEHHPDDLEYEPERRRVLRLVVIDFGLTRLRHRSDPIENGHGAGTPGYTAPEIGAGEDARPFADVFSLGAILFHAVVGAAPPSPPAEAEVEAERDRLRQSGEDITSQAAAEILFDGTIARALAEIRTDRNLAAIIRRALAYSPPRRYTMEGLGADLRRYRDGLIPQTRLKRSRRDGERDPAGTGEVLTSFCRRNLLTFAIAASFLVAIAIGVANVWDRYQRQRHDAHAARIGAGRTLVKEGRYPEALPYLDAALADEVEADRKELDRLHLRVLYGLNRRPIFDQVLERLTKNPTDSSDPEVQFIRGDFFLSDPEHTDEGRRILRSIEGRLANPADQDYVRGLLTTDLIEARRHWQDAVRTDYFHHLARRSLVANLIVCGEFAEAQRQLDTARALFPWDPAWDLVESLADFCQRDRPSLERHTKALIDKAKPQGLQDTAVAYRDALQHLDDTMTGLDMFKPSDSSQASGMGPDVLTLVPRVTKLFSNAAAFDRLNREAMAELGFRIASVTPLIETIPRLRRSMGNLLFLRYDRMAEELEAALASQPEAMLAYFAGSAHILSARVAMKQRKPEEANRQCRLARDLYLRATKLMTLLPKTEFRYVSRCCAAMLEASLIVEEKDTSPDRRARLATLIQTLVPEGRAFKADREKLLPPTAKVLVNVDRDACRMLLLTWHCDEPESTTPLAVLAQLEFDLGHTELAADFAGKFLAMPPAKPGDRRGSMLQSQMQSLLEKARKKPESPTVKPTKRSS